MEARTTTDTTTAGDAADHLLDRALALRGVELAAKIFLSDDVGRVLRPRGRELDIALLERDVVAMADQRVADLPLDAVERVPTGRREEAAQDQSLARGCRVDGACSHAVYLSASRRRRPGEWFGGVEDVPPPFGRNVGSPEVQEFYRPWVLGWRVWGCNTRPKMACGGPLRSPYPACRVPCALCAA